MHPYRLNPLVAKYEEDFPLRKTGQLMKDFSFIVSVICVCDSSNACL